MKAETAEAIERKIEEIVTAVGDLRRMVWGAVEPDRFADMLASCQKKKRYGSVEAAGQAAESAKKARSEVGDLRIYTCAFCDGYHLTSSPLDKFAERTG